ncbi:MAG: hypothetical protein EOP51_01790 [Sphingobacteriales bacterium]|nr:MAG: hypothetical protein EOP51_01790 [Sphingobacteriales bacterium]
MENQNTNRKLVTGMFTDRESAERAYSSLHTRGYAGDDVHVMMSDKARDTHFANTTVKTELGNKALEGAGTGSAIGTTLGAVAGAIAAIGTNLVLPGLGLIIAGPLAAGLAGAGAGAATGGIIGALVGAGIPEERAKIYEDGVKKGNIVLGVHTKNDEDADYFANDWRANNGSEIHR